MTHAVGWIELCLWEAVGVRGSKLGVEYPPHAPVKQRASNDTQVSARLVTIEVSLPRKDSHDYMKILAHTRTHVHAHYVLTTELHTATLQKSAHTHSLSLSLSLSHSLTLAF